ncbi:hypothetical protein DQ392_08435 [Streptomyces reniochalinae]|uniref:Peptidase M10 metallopeptidase domain-containing protein n=1 Tax=Streptomyces reniochalinae TaxID=2250578 RepID=A0A367EUP5_9ACTN|nr:hypothetical protein DQ392_08435 [Streptomyces reniochalinae]
MLLTGSQAGATTTRTAATQTGTVVTQGTGWKHATILGVTSVSPTKTYTITFDTAAMKARYAPYYTEAIKQIRDAGIHIQVGGVEPVDVTKCGPADHIQITELHRPLGTPGWSQGMPCPFPDQGMSRGGMVAYDSEYWDGTWYMPDYKLKNTIVHEVLHAIGLDHPNVDLDGDGIAGPYECVATSYGNKPIMCSPNGGYSTSNAGKLVGYDVNGLKALVANARAQGLS